MFYIIFTIGQIRIIVIIIIVCTYNIGIIIIETSLMWRGIAHIHILRQSHCNNAYHLVNKLALTMLIISHTVQNKRITREDIDRYMFDDYNGDDNLDSY